MSGADEKMRADLEALIEKWRDRANQEEYKLHREWAIDQCADELEAALAAAQGQPEKESGR